MRIQKNLPQFTDQPALLVATGRVSAVMYLAHAGKLKLIQRLEERPEYFSDNEGHFETRSIRLGRGRAQTMASGSVREPRDDNRVKRFTRQLRTELWRLIHREDIAVLYIFTPKEHEILSQLQTKLQRKVREVVKGDFTQEHPFKLLERLQVALGSRKVKPAPPVAARRLLRKTRIAREVGVVPRKK